MTIEYCAVAERLLAEVQAAHVALVAHAGAGAAARRGLRAVYEALAAGVTGMSEEQALAAPSPEEWSMAEVLEHVVEHDRKYVEYERLGVDHYIEHGLEHTLQLWRLRPPPAPAGSSTGSRDGSTPGG